MGLMDKLFGKKEAEHQPEPQPAQTMREMGMVHDMKIPKPLTEEQQRFCRDEKVDEKATEIHIEAKTVRKEQTRDWSIVDVDLNKDSFRELSDFDAHQALVQQAQHRNPALKEAEVKINASQAPPKTARELLEQAGVSSEMSTEKINDTRVKDTRESIKTADREHEKARELGQSHDDDRVIL